jgi:hypothetical protein
MCSVKLRFATGFIAFLMSSTAALCQSDSLALSSGVVAPGGTVTLSLSLTSPTGSQPAGLQWTFSFDSTQIVAVNASAGPSTTGAGATMTCAAATGAYTCLVDGMNASSLQNGVVATVAMTVAASASTTNVAVSNPLGASAAASAILVIGSGGTITVTGSQSLGLTSVGCNPPTVATPGTTNCTVYLTGAVASGNTAVVGLSSNSSYLVVPASVTVPGAASSATFAATAASVPNTLTAVITAALGSSLQTANVVLQAAGNPVVSSLQCVPASLNSGGSSSCTVSLSQSAASATTVSLASNNAVLSTPASVSVPAGSAKASFTATAGSFTTSQQAVVTATLGASSQTAAISLTAGIGISYLQCAIGALGVNGSTACLLMLSQPAPQSGANVTLSSNDPALTVPASVTVTAGQTAAGFTATAGTFTTAQTAVITGTLGGSSLTTSETLTPLALASLQCSPSSLSSGSASTCTVSLNQSAPSSTAVALGSNSTSLTVPATVAVSAGATSATFAATAGTVTVGQNVTVTATLAGSSQTATLTLVGSRAISFLQCAISSLGINTPTACMVMLSQPAPESGSTVALSSNDPALTVPASVVVASGQTSAGFTATAGTFTTTQTAVITGAMGSSSMTTSETLVPPVGLLSLQCSPASLPSGNASTCTVTLNQPAPTGGSAVTVSSNNAALTVPASSTVPANSASTTFSASLGTIAINQSATVTATLNGASQGASLSLVAPVLVSTLACNLTSVNSGASTTCTVTLNQPAPAGGSAAGLSSNNAALTVPAAVAVSANASSANFSATVGNITSNQTAAITATLNSASQSASLSLVAPAVSALACSPTSVNFGASTTCTVTLNQAAPTGGTVVALSDNSTPLTIPVSVSVAAGAASATFVATVGTLTTTQPATISATLNGTQSATLTLVAPVLISALACNATTLDAGASSSCSLTLSLPAPGGGAIVSISANGEALTVPGSVNIPAGASTATFSATATTEPPEGGATETVSVTATLNGVSQSQSFTLIICPCSVWPSTAQPLNPASTNTQAIEVGMQFNSNTSGYVTGVRFFKGSTNKGTHVGHLWTATGTLLAQVNFNHETKSGWQIAYFQSPIAIAANTTYVISYYAPQGHNAADNGSFTTPVSNLPLQALADGQNGPNGVSSYGSGVFPTTGASATNYWVDPIFNTSAVVGTAPPVSIWAPTAVPNTPSTTSSQAAELGLTFTSDVPGYVTGLRFYKSVRNLGTHVGYLWTATGTELAGVEFTNETASGWQQANFSSPIAINANTPYVVSYWSPRGHYADDLGYFATSGVTNQMLYAPPDGQYGPNDTSATSNIFPTGSSNGTNYWVDVVFTTAIQ